MIDDVKIPYYNIVFILFVSFLFVSGALIAQLVRALVL